jgi:hypothetical protein
MRRLAGSISAAEKYNAAKRSAGQFFPLLNVRYPTRGESRRAEYDRLDDFATLEPAWEAFALRRRRGAFKTVRRVLHLVNNIT